MSAGIKGILAVGTGFFIFARQSWEPIFTENSGIFR